MTSQMEMQLGKNGLTKELLENIKISVLKSARESKADVKKYAEEIISFLGSKFTFKVMGFSIFLKKWRKARNI